MTNIFERRESSVQAYGRWFPRLFERADGEFLWDHQGNRYLDFLSGAGALNYGHNNPLFKERLLQYISGDGVTLSLDMFTVAKRDFLEALQTKIFEPRKLDYRVQFTGPTGTNAVEAALKIARANTGRRSVVAFTNAFHGVSLGSLAMTGTAHHRGAAGVGLDGVIRMPYDGYLGDGVDTIAYLDKVLCDSSSGIDQPAAVILEVVQGEGGLNVASAGWLQRLQELCTKHGSLLIIDDIQAGCGRTGDFFSFEQAKLYPDIVVLSKSLSGYGLPLSVVLLKPQYDCWKPGEHNGTFRGNNLAFVTGAAALEHYWSDDRFATELQQKGAYIGQAIDKIVAAHAPGMFAPCGRGMFRGIACADAPVAEEIKRAAFRRGLIVETSGPDDQVVKLFCPLTISDDSLRSAFDIIDLCIGEVLTERSYNA